MANNRKIRLELKEAHNRIAILEQEEKPDSVKEPKNSSNDANYGNGKGSGGKKNKKRILYPEDLRREVKEIDVAEDLRACDCGKIIPIVGYTSNDVINYKPEEFYIIKEPKS